MACSAKKIFAVIIMSLMQNATFAEGGQKRRPYFICFWIKVYIILGQGNKCIAVSDAVPWLFMSCCIPKIFAIKSRSRSTKLQSFG